MTRALQEHDDRRRRARLGRQGPATAGIIGADCAGALRVLVLESTVVNEAVQEGEGRRPRSRLESESEEKGGLSRRTEAVSS